MKNDQLTKEEYLSEIGWTKPQKLNFALITIGEVYQMWCIEHFPKISKNLSRTYVGIWKKSFINIADMPFIDLRVDHLQAILDYYYLENLSKSWLEKFRQLSNHLYSFAIKKGIVKHNYAHYLKINNNISQTKNKREIFSDEEIKLLFSYSTNKSNLYWHDARLTLILIFTGFRPSELFNIQIKDVNLQEGYFIGGAKTAAGKFRMVPILPVIEDYILEEYQTLKRKKASTYAFFFQTEKGYQINLSNWRARKFYPLLKELHINSLIGKPRINPYSARHTFASLAYSAQVDKLILQKVIGHVDFEMLSKIYIHTNIEQYRNELKKVNKLFENSEN